MAPKRRMKRRGNCYVASEALYHILGGRDSYWRPMYMRIGNDTHWFLKHGVLSIILDPSVKQFKQKPEYNEARGSGFLTVRPSKRARALIKQLTWQEGK